jgi:hypothetical protein
MNETSEICRITKDAFENMNTPKELILWPMDSFKLHFHEHSTDLGQFLQVTVLLCSEQHACFLFKGSWPASQLSSQDFRCVPKTW